MFSYFSKKAQSIVSIVLMSFIVLGLSACDAEPPKPMKAVKQFDSEAMRAAHVKDVRKNHMNALKHKRDETMIKGIRTEENSLKACISCHVPEKFEGEVLRHTNPKHFCSTCHGYVAAQLDCFQCHADHPLSGSSDTAKAPNDEVHKNTLAINSKQVITGESVSE